MKYFLLDKKFAIEGKSRCIGISDKPFTQEEIEKAKLIYDTKETIVYKSTDKYEDIPHHIEYDPVNNTIVEKIIDEIEEISTYSDIVSQEEKIFNEDVEIEPKMYYFYIDKNIADTEFIAVNIATFKKPLLEPNKYFQKEVYEIKGKEYPNYITIEDGKIREATEYEKYTRGQRKLQDREVAFKNEIIYLEDGWYIQDDELIKVEKPSDMVKPIFNEETHIWEETATQDEIDLDLVETQYNEYEPLDTYSTVEQMKRQDPALAEEYVDMMIELRELRASMQNNNDSEPKVRTRRSVFSIHEPSEKLKLFKEKFSN